MGTDWCSQAILEHGSAYKSVQGRWPGLQGLGFLLLLLWLLLKALPDFVLGRERGRDEMGQAGNGRGTSSRIQPVGCLAHPCNDHLPGAPYP